MQSNPRRLRVLGLMSGTSMDGVDAAIIETDGVSVTRIAGSMAAFAPADRDRIEQAVEAARQWKFHGHEPDIFAEVSDLIADRYAEAAQLLLSDHGPVDLVGAHGQTVLHRAPLTNSTGDTRQLLNAGRLRSRLGVPLVYDFRRQDMKAGGYGAPLAPVYHRAMLTALGHDGGGVVLNLGGVANLTIWHGGDDIHGFDTGPASMLMDRWCQRHGRGNVDKGGLGAARGRVDSACLSALMSHPYLVRKAPKSLDRHDFDLTAIEGLSFEDGLATLLEFTVQSVADALRREAGMVECVVVVGGGVHNTTLMARLGGVLGVPVTPAQELGWSADWLEAELMAYCAARSLEGLAITFPGTTGVSAPMTGGTRL